MVDSEAKEVISSNGFLYLSHSMLSKILQRSLHAKESLIYERAIAWAREECKRQAIAPTSENVRSMLGDAFFLIRFPKMSFDEFSQGPANSNYLTPQEKVDIFLWYSKQKPPARFSTESRVDNPPMKCSRFRKVDSSAVWGCFGSTDAIDFRVNRAVTICGYGIYGNKSGGEYRAWTELRRSSTSLATHSCNSASSGASQTFQVLFDNPVQ
ncbi:BTB (POZ) domain containing 3, partial [Aphelenchoides avenae]